jgi:hypothetical protein
MHLLLRQLNYIAYFLGLALVLGIIIPISMQSAKAASDYAEAIVANKTYKFDWDYKRESADEGVFVFKNSKSHEDTVSAKSGSIIGARIFYCCEDGVIKVSLTKDTVKVTHANESGSEADKIIFGKLFNAELINDCDVAQQKGCQQDWKLPNVEKGTYCLLFGIFGSDETHEYYLTKIKVS